MSESTATCIDILIAVILPPLGVFLKFGFKNLLSRDKVNRSRQHDVTGSRMQNVDATVVSFWRLLSVFKLLSSWRVPSRRWTLWEEDLETLIHENQDLQAQLDAVAAPQAAPAEEEPEEDAGEESDVDYEPLAPTGADRPGPSGTAGVQAWQMVRTRNTNELHGEQPEGSRARETDSPLGTPPPPPPSNPMQMMAQFFASMMESQQQQAEFMREGGTAKPSNS
ncbi:hypothetical protein PR202_ga23144 [Eleusine coracana subsp. coracana]|uniref:Uncharacterized protein n=1 Tax=Eleusine coracana subsp. coracana TaxID=191504 RepID=A0AAV5D5S3_ELECO|nr:hypothetical protein PR202_ga23144 [Eleusine coracana subsp. coracana]